MHLPNVQDLFHAGSKLAKYIYWESFLFSSTFRNDISSHAIQQS